MKKYQIDEETINQIIEWSHNYGRSMQFNIGLFGAECEQSKFFTEQKTKDYIHEQIVKNLGEI